MEHYNSLLGRFFYLAGFQFGFSPFCVSVFSVSHSEMAVYSGLACWSSYSTVNIYAFLWVKLSTCQFTSCSWVIMRFVNIGTLEAILYLMQ